MIYVMKPRYTKYPEYCNVNTGICIIPVQFIEPFVRTDMHLPNECF